jgi:hypothetical protein
MTCILQGTILFLYDNTVYLDLMLLQGSFCCILNFRLVGTLGTSSSHVVVIICNPRPESKLILMTLIACRAGTLEHLVLGSPVRIDLVVIESLPTP